MNSGVRRLADLRREASDAARELQGGEEVLDARELRILLGVSSAVASASSLEELLDLAADQTLPALGAASVSVSRWESEASLFGASQKETGTDPVYGAGAQVRVGSFALRLEYERFDFDDDSADLVSLGFTYTFL